MIEVNNLTRTYGDFVAVDDISFSIPRGQIVGLLGHNGAGKTTIMKVLTGYLEPTQGVVSIAGLDITANRLAVQEKIGYLPEHSPLYPEMSVVQYLDYVCQLRSVPETGRAQAISCAVERTGLSEKAFDLIATLSKGYMQRVGVAQAIIHNPEILIMDEATSGLDPSQIQGMRDLIQELSSDATVILSTHIMQEVEAVCDRAIIISRGRISADAGLDELQSSNRLVVELNQDLAAAGQVLRELNGVGDVICTGSTAGVSQFLLSLSGPEAEVAPQVAQAVAQRGWALHRLSVEERSLETVFREIDTGVAGGMNVEQQ